MIEQPELKPILAGIGNALNEGFVHGKEAEMLPKIAKICEKVIKKEWKQQKNPKKDHNFFL